VRLNEIIPVHQLPKFKFLVSNFIRKWWYYYHFYPCQLSLEPRADFHRTWYEAHATTGDHHIAILWNPYFQWHKLGNHASFRGGTPP